VLVEHFGFTANELEQISLNAIRASFLTPEQKADYTQQFTAEFARLQKSLVPGE
jgi:adenosine deaminase